MDLRIIPAALLLLLASCGGEAPVERSVPEEELPPMTADEGKNIFLLHCESCHGIDGKKGVSDAADLSVSKLSDEQVKNVIRNGNDKGMMPFRDIIPTDRELDGVVAYVKSLRVK
jgi:mono/diheme cytochrome c family protein